MKILYLITKSEAGGAQTHVAQLVNYFGTKNEVVVMSGGEGWLKSQCQHANVRYMANKYFSNSMHPWRMWKAIKEVKKIAETMKPDIVHCHSSAAALVARLAIRGRYKTVYTAHGWGFNVGMNPLIRYVVLLTERFTARYTDTYIAVSQFVKELGIKYGLPAHKFEVIYNGVDSSDTLHTTHVDNKLNIIFVGRLTEPKRPEMIIEAIGGLEEHVKHNLIFTIVGDGEKKERLKHIAQQKKVNVVCRGNLEHKKVMEELSKHDIFIFISAWEGFPYTILEAMSCGLPIIASNVGGVSEAVDPRVGRMVDNETTKIRQALLELIGDEELRKNMGEEAKKLVKQKFSIDKMLVQTEGIYTQILKS